MLDFTILSCDGFTKNCKIIMHDMTQCNFLIHCEHLWNFSTHFNMSQACYFADCVNVKWQPTEERKYDLAMEEEILIKSRSGTGTFTHIVFVFFKVSNPLLPCSGIRCSVINVKPNFVWMAHSSLCGTSVITNKVLDKCDCFGHCPLS